jgi:GNAT superfamily N-acetyltransferase
MEHDDAGARWRIRSGQDSDGPALIALIWACWSAYPGIRMDVDREMPELHALATYYGGALWVAEAGGAVCGMIAVRPLLAGEWEVCRVYVDPAMHGSGLGHALLDVAERHAIARGAGRLMLWSDTRFDRAHRFYEKRSYVRYGPVRVLHDISNSLEFGYAKPFEGVESLDIAAATSAVERLAAILIACVDAGASVSFLKPLAPDEARAFWQRAATGVGAGQRVIVAAWRDGILVGTGTLDLGTPETQPHRGDVQMILVDPGSQRRGLGRQILRALEHAAATRGRSLLTSETCAGEVGEAMFRVEDWQEAGRIAGFTRDADGSAHATVFFWKQIAR